MIDRSKTRDTRATGRKGRTLCGTRVAETILASVHVRPRQQAGHMDASDLIKPLRTTCEEGAVHIWGPEADWHVLICLAFKGSFFGAYSHLARRLEYFRSFHFG